MADSDKNIVISPQRGSATLSPSIVFTGKGNDPITLRVIDADTGGLNFEGSEGQLFGISNSLSSGKVFSANFISGIPAIDVDASGLIRLAPLVGSVSIGSDVTANRYRTISSLILNSYQTVNPGSNVFLYSQPNDRDSWIYLDSADTGSNWGIYHRQIDSVVNDLPANSIGFIGGGNNQVRAYISLQTGNGYFSGNVGIGTTNPATKLAVFGEASVGQGKKLSLIGLDINSVGTPAYIKIRTTIPAASASADFTVTIKGFRYDGSQNLNIDVSWHWYNATFWNPSVTSYGSWAPVVRLSNEAGLVCITLTSPGYWPKLYVESMYSSSYADGYATGWTWVDEDAAGINITTLAYKSNFGNEFVMKSDGNVGIGTTNPGTKLDVNGEIRSVGNNDPNYSATLVGRYDSAHSLGLYTRINSSTNSEILGVYAEGGGVSPRTIINPSNGWNVGIGTTSPSSRLTVNGYITESTDSGATYWNVVTQQDVGTSPNQVPLNQYLGQLAFLDDIAPNSLRRDGGSVDDVYVDASGRLGIGTTNPNNMLEVYTQLGDCYISATRGSTIAGQVALKLGGGSGGVNWLIYQQVASNDLRFYDGSGDRMTIKSGGNVGIGTTNPAYKFEISQADYSRLTLLQSTTGKRWQIGNDGSNFYVFNESNAVRALDITSTGNVGIGAGSPTKKLEVAGGEVSFSTNTAGKDTHLFTTNASNDGRYLIKSDITTKVDIQANGNTYFNGGNVGIGTSNPQKILEVITPASDYASVGVAGLAEGAWTGIHFGYRENNTAYRKSVLAFERRDSAARGKIHILNNNDNNSNSVQSIAADARLTIQSDGNVGIGTTSPASKLDIRLGSAGIIAGFHGSEGRYLQTGTDTGGHWIESQGTQASERILRFQVFDGGSGYAQFFIDGANKYIYSSSNCNVGIATTNPLQRLDVRGKFLLAADATTSTHITQVPYTINNGTLSWEGTAGQLFSITNNLTSGSIFSVNDVSGIPSIDVDANGTIELAPFGGNVGVGTINPGFKLDVNGSVGIRNTLGISESGGSGNRLLISTSGSGAIFNQNDNSNISFQTQGVTRFTIAHSSDNVGIGTGSPGSAFKLDVFGNIRLGANLSATATTTPAYLSLGQSYSNGFTRANCKIRLYDNGADVYGFSIGPAGDVQYHSTTTHQFYNNDSPTFTINAAGASSTGNITAYSSDKRLKENFTYIKNPLEKVQKLNGYTFDWNAKSEELGFTPQYKQNDVGLIAQEVQEVLPQAAVLAPFDRQTNSNGEVVSKSGENYLTIQYERLIPLLVEAIKEQQKQIDSLKDEIEKMKGGN